MQTEIIRIQGDNKEGISRGGQLLRQGGLVVFPTETVYGLGANALSDEAVSKIYVAKGRPSDNPLIVHISSIEELEPLVAEVPPQAKKLADRFWPGPLTMIFKKSPLVGNVVSGGLPTVAVRMPENPIARALIREAGVPVAAPSANLSGSPSPTCFAHAFEDMNGRVEAIMDGGSCAYGVESTVLTLAVSPARLLRPGAVTPEQLREILPDLEIDPAVTERMKEGEKAASPGMKYKHYAPKAHVILVDGSPAAYREFVESRRGEGVFALCFEEDAKGLTIPCVSYGRREDHREQARELFFCLRQLDQLQAKTVYAHCPNKSGVGLAVYNRLIRAAGFEVITL